MASAIYPKFKESLLKGEVGDISSAPVVVKAALIDTNDVAYNAAHQYLSDVSDAVVDTTAALENKTITNGQFDADDIAFEAASGDQSEAIILFIDSGDAGTSRLMCFIDQFVSGMPVTPNGGDISVTWGAYIFAL
jgi:hypothetical protein